MASQLERLDHHLDRLEDQLPALPAAGLRLQRTLAARSYQTATELTRTWWDALGNTAERASTAASTVVGTGRSAGERAATAAATAARQISGQTEAQVRSVVDRANREVTEASSTTTDIAGRAAADATRALDAATAAADPGRTPTGDAYEDLTRAELLRRAAEADISGRTRMTKSELIASLTGQAEPNQ